LTEPLLTFAVPIKRSPFDCGPIHSVLFNDEETKYETAPIQYFGT